MSSQKSETMKVKTLRLKDSVSSLITTIAKEKNLSDSEYIRSLVEKDIFKFKINKAINAYKKREINISKGAKIIGVSYREFLDILEERAVPLNMDDFPIDYGLASIEKSLSLTVKNKFKKNK